MRKCKCDTISLCIHPATFHGKVLGMTFLEHKKSFTQEETVVRPSLFEAQPIESFPLLQKDTRTTIPFTITLGLHEDAVRALIARSSVTPREDPALFAFFNDQGKFGSMEAYKVWYGKGDEGPFPISACTGEGEYTQIGLLIWFTPIVPPPATLKAVGSDTYAWDSFSLRTYPPFRGKGLSHPISTFALSWHDAHRKDRSLWLKVDKENGDAIRLYKKLLFQEVNTMQEQYNGTERNKIIMVQKRES